MRRCGLRDAEADESSWMIHHLGPFVGVGGGDWHQVWVHPLPLPSNVNFITGKLGVRGWPPAGSSSNLLPPRSHQV